MDKKAALINIGDEGSPRCQVVAERHHEENLEIDWERAAHYIQLPGDKGLAPMGIDDMSVEHGQLVRVHSFAAESYWTGKKLY